MKSMNKSQVCLSLNLNQGAKELVRSMTHGDDWNGFYANTLLDVVLNNILSCS